MMDENMILNDDIDMLNSAVDLNTIHNKSSSDNGGNMNFNMDEHRNDDNSNDNNDEEGDDFYMIESDSKTPGEILDDFCSKLSDVNTTLPDSVIAHYMKKTGFIVNDPKLVKVVSIASQKFISEIVNDVMQHHKLKSKTSGGGQAATSSSGTNVAGSANLAGTGSGSNQSSQQQQASTSTQANSNKAKSVSTVSTVGLTLTLEDLSQVLTEYGINVKKPYYFM